MQALGFVKLRDSNTELRLSLVRYVIPHTELKETCNTLCVYGLFSLFLLVSPLLLFLKPEFQWRSIFSIIFSSSYSQLIANFKFNAKTF